MNFWFMVYVCKHFVNQKIIIAKIQNFEKYIGYNLLKIVNIIAQNFF